MSNAEHTTIQDSIRDHFRGRISPDSERRMRQHLRQCDECRRAYDRYWLLQQMDPAQPNAKERIARGLGLSPGREKPSWLLWPALATAATAAVLLMAWPRHDGFTARGTATAGAAATSELLIYEVASGNAPKPVAGSISAGAELAFGYRNVARKPWLMIFGVDEHRHVYWYFPAWSDPAQNPTAVAAAVDSERHELSEAVRHSYDGQQLRVVALFLEQPLSVRDVEQVYAAADRPSMKGALSGSVEVSIPVRIVP